jgi:lipoate-protein ligase A
MDAVRLIDDPAAAGSWNMAVDQALLSGINDAGSIALRFYRWSPATLTLGYFQSARQRDEHPPSAECAVVRRVTGGGAILHDRELTYSLCVPRGHRLAAANTELYRHIHDAVRGCLRVWGIEARLQAESDPARSSRFLCFERRSPGDILVGEFKIGGSAQRRREGAVLQHGSIVLSTSPHAPELPGLSELSGMEISTTMMRDGIIAQLERSMNWRFAPSNLNEREQLNSREIQKKQFDQHAWNFGR